MLWMEKRFGMGPLFPGDERDAGKPSVSKERRKP